MAARSLLPRPAHAVSQGWLFLHPRTLRQDEGPAAVPGYAHWSIPNRRADPWLAGCRSATAASAART
jgi:hypothetical protein